MKLNKGRSTEQLRQYSYVNLVEEMLEDCGKQLPFKEITAIIEEALEVELSDIEISQLYTDVTVDGRFVPLSDGSFNLRSRHKFEDFQVELFLYDEEEEKALEELIEIEEASEPLEVYEDEDGVVSLDVIKQKESLIDAEEFEM